MAEVLNEYFTSVFTREPEGSVPNPGTEEAESLLEDIVITEVDILKKIKDLRRGAAAGPDGIGPAFLQDFRQIWHRHYKYSLEKSWMRGWHHLTGERPTLPQSSRKEQSVTLATTAQ